MEPKKITINCDGGSRGNPGPAASAFVVTQNNQIIYSQGKYLGITTNNQAEYAAVILGLKWLESSGYIRYQASFQLDSLLVVNQIKGIYKVKDPNIKLKYIQVLDLIKNCKLKNENFSYVPRSQNFLADKLVNNTLNKQAS
jgi:ribonuclease HI